MRAVRPNSGLEADTRSHSERHIPTAKRRWKFDDGYVRQERAFEKGLQPADNFTPVRAILVRDEEPAGVKADGPAEPGVGQE